MSSIPIPVDKAAIEKLPFIQRVPADGRIPLLLPYYDASSKEWWLTIEDGRGGIDSGKVHDLVAGAYLAESPANPATDYELLVETLIVQHLSFPGVYPHIGKLESDINRCAAILEKYQLISACRSEGPAKASLLAASELEYLYLLLRSTFDVLQGTARSIGLLFTAEEGEKHRMQELPPSFADVVMKENELRSADEVKAKWKIPEPLVTWYMSEAPFFRELRIMRDGIAHRGQQVPTIYTTERGLAVDIRNKPWSNLNFWQESPIVNGNLGSLRLIFANFISHSIRSTDRFANTIKAVVRLPTAVHGQLRVFLRSPITHWLVDLDVLSASPWEGAGSTA